MWQHPGVDGVVFTGSREVGLRIHQGISRRWVKPVLMELGGKNATVVTRNADLDAAAEGVMRSAFSLQNQKCSATSRVYVERAVAAEFVERLLERTRAIRMGDPTERDVYFGPVINARAVARYERAAAQAREEGTVLRGRGPAPRRRVRPRALRRADRSPASAHQLAVSGRAVRADSSRSARWTASTRRWPRPTRPTTG